MADRFSSITVFDRLLAELGIAHGQFEHEVSRFLLSPRGWLEERLRAMGWVRVAEKVKCERACCR